MNEKELKKLMIDKDINVIYLSDILGISKQATHKKVNGETAFSIEDIRILKKHHVFNNKEIQNIFFD